jgi:transposase InsO family protein
MWTSITVRNGRLLKRGAAYYVPLDVGFRAELLRCYHDDPVAGHFGFSRMLELLSRKYFWFGMRADVKRYVNTCVVYQRTKVKRHLLYGELSTFPLPSRPWQEITMDFITGLPPSKHNGAIYDSILVVVDRYTKMVRYLHVTKTIDAPTLAEIFVQKIFKDFGAPAGITTDRGTQFTSNFWSMFCFLLGIRRRLSTAFRPQTDGQTERQNQTLEYYLRCYCTYNQSDWLSKLALAEFVYNNSEQSSIGMSPFRACYSFAPRIQNIEDDVPGGEAPLAKERIEALAREYVLLTTHLRSA